MSIRIAISKQVEGGDFILIYKSFLAGHEDHFVVNLYMMPGYDINLRVIIIYNLKQLLLI